ncbi:MAG: N-acetyl-gamma-glutamyl-phosphate reductase [Candidatus Raymondbacteria bacterium RifOxyC12_full_50_8]|uniref:N-acetyl-gamma-glutamyl-phosphate reductase n=1 Tax=Candidatus Raymondbacteria bacterium RIFOXYD12_FULL_49_13 TaxID=1817890 RepID=A0A1F7FIL1_UNCRA|nr:MAG: N-acetyl-gamma-glutamyl-phosphate reductase [Candidatus Raymondbacteria bacterium RIFOXYA2_FULL_49_16]OGJ95693.1 MAG: N-acetyl-gamma-glutamyl-phosphate reductase [Candidatus Raymondbacteria bacterium RifOxyB12_full_50_8]OGK05944.1 MAG: N-acetyl-gamma-glutamyl-phosphate reductase [Candidatus Raymondbacteria bacterium RifOxyC12_full_50_8]OGK06302.1 MAG: N-acetyl-gamma-glutamyl-phosphate reductase [Candidatus Raymondbacteria bacterium RIFOXYD12_FULL_49_13]OGP40635.1 MAG: N-acetyl-gamma-glu
MKKIRACIVGATGYGGRETIKMFLRHPHVEIASVAADDSFIGTKISDSFQDLRGLVDLTCQKADTATLAQSCDVAMLGTPHGIAMKMAPVFLKAGVKVIDFSADFRIQNTKVFEAFYGMPQSAPDLLAKAVYGLPELNADEVKKADLLSNPGCFPTSVILGLAPLLKKGLTEPHAFSVSITGTSGAGRKAALSMLHAELEGTIRPYRIGKHQHTPEMEQELSALAGEKFTLNFVPELGGFSRGIISTLNIRLKAKKSVDELIDLYKQFYAGKRFIRVYDKGQYPELRNVIHTNFCDIGVYCEGTDCLIFSAIDNLLKGQAGQAVQNMNLMFGFDEAAGLP